MTPEERFTKIENAIQSLTETQVRHDEQLDKQNAAIRDLIAVSRMLLDSQQGLVGSYKEMLGSFKDLFGSHKELLEAQKELFEAQRATDIRLNALIETVDRLSDTVNNFVQGLRKPNGNQ